MKKEDYITQSIVADFLEYLKKELPTFSHSYIYKGKSNDPRSGQKWTTSSFLGASADLNDSKSFSGYWWPFECDVVSGTHFVHHKGYTMKRSSSALCELSKLLARALTEDDDVSAQMACQGILSWGGVLKGNQQRVFNKANGLCKCLSCLKTFLESPDLDDQIGALRIRDELWMNAGFTKIFASLVDDFCMYDGRVGAALGLLVRLFSERQQLDGVHKLLSFPWGEGAGRNREEEKNRRNPSCMAYHFPMLTGSKSDVKRHALWNIRANWLLKELISRFDGIEQGRVSALRRVEASLFMIGYDISNKCNQTKAPSDISETPFDGSTGSDQVKFEAAPSKAERMSKKACARRVYLENSSLKRREILKLFVSECGLTENGASTYYQQIRTESSNGSFSKISKDKGP